MASLIEEMAGLLYRELRDRHLSPHTGGYPSQPAEVREQYREVCRRLFNMLAEHSGVVQDPPHAGPGELPVRGYIRRRIHRAPGTVEPHVPRSSAEILREGYEREHGSIFDTAKVGEEELGEWEDAGGRRPAEGALDAGGLGEDGPRAGDPRDDVRA